MKNNTEVLDKIIRLNQEHEELHYIYALLEKARNRINGYHLEADQVLSIDVEWSEELREGGRDNFCASSELYEICKRFETEIGIRAEQVLKLSKKL